MRLYHFTPYHDFVRKIEYLQVSNFIFY